VLSSARRLESLALAASVGYLEASIVDFLCRRIAESGPSPVLGQAVKGSMHGRENGNVELRPSCRSYCRLPMSHLSSSNVKATLSGLTLSDRHGFNAPKQPVMMPVYPFLGQNWIEMRTRAAKPMVRRKCLEAAHPTILGAPMLGSLVLRPGSVPVLVHYCTIA
jgi:hypothetical protein